MEQIPGTPVENAALPRNWERAVGYEGQARYLAVWWEPCGDEIVFSDGQVTATGNWPFFLHLTRETWSAALHLALDGALWALGSSEEPATHRLLLDLQERRGYVVTVADAEAFLAAQWPVRETQTVQVTLEQLTGWLEAAGGRLGDYTPADICGECGGFGWLTASDGYEACPVCNGQGVVK